MIFIPIFVILSKRIGKKMCYNIGMSLVTVSIMIFFFTGHKLSVNFSFLFMFITGIGLATNYVMPWSIIPDTIEFDYSNTKERKEGMFYGIWTFFTKLGQALAAFIIGWILSSFNYIPEAVQTTHAKLGIRFLIGPIPALFFITGILIHSFYPIDQKKYNEILNNNKKNETSK